jgi:hypothetical protein
VQKGLVVVVVLVSAYRLMVDWMVMMGLVLVWVVALV